MKAPKQRCVACDHPVAKYDIHLGCLNRIERRHSKREAQLAARKEPVCQGDVS
jgi:hypothetical protein